jgi:uncharacterized protein with FMN-binding domain
MVTLPAGVSADEIELVSGKRYQGRLITRTTGSITFKIMFASGGSVVTEFPARKVRSLNVTGKDPVFAKPPAPGPKPQPRPATQPKAQPPDAKSPTQPAGSTGRTRSQAEVNTMIQNAGKNRPEWWDSVQLNYPQTLDLAGTNPVKGWHPKRNLGTYMWSIINLNPGRWKEGIRLLHHVLSVRKADRPRLREAMNMLAGSYYRLLRDWARAAFWWQKVIAMQGRAQLDSLVGLADCYFRLGSKPMAVALLRKYGLDRYAHRLTIKLWAEMGELRRALQLAEALARRQPEQGYLAAGDACRVAGQYDEAVAYYRKGVSAPGGRDKRSRDRAQASIEAIRLYENLDLSRIPDGTYAGSSPGYRGPVHVAVKIQGGRIDSVAVTRHKEDIFYTAPTEIPRRIVESQGVLRVDAVTGATFTSEAIVSATARALAKAMK